MSAAPCIYYYSSRIPLSSVELLLVSLFKTGSTVNPTHEEKYIYVLAYATSVWDRASEVSVPSPGRVQLCLKFVCVLNGRHFQMSWSRYLMS